MRRLVTLLRGLHFQPGLLPIVASITVLIRRGRRRRIVLLIPALVLLPALSAIVLALVRPTGTVVIHGAVARRQPSGPAIRGCAARPTPTRVEAAEDEEDEEDDYDERDEEDPAAPC